MNYKAFKSAFMVLLLIAGQAAVASAGVIAFTQDNGGNSDIYLMNDDGTDVSPLVSDPDADGSPTFSPDGSKLAFHSDRTGEFAAYIINVDGTGLYMVPNSAANPPYGLAYGTLAWSPDGQKLVYPTTNQDIATINIDGTGKTVISTAATAPYRTVFGVGWGPSMDEIVVTLEKSPWEKQLYKYTISSDSWTQLTTDVSPSHPSSGPDVNAAGEVVFTRRASWSQLYDLYVVDNQAGSPSVNLTNLPLNASAFSPEWANDGQQVVFQYNPDNGPNSYVASINADGSGFTVLTDPLSGSYGDPTWSPGIVDGDGIVLWNTLDDETAILNSEIGPDFTISDPNQIFFVESVNADLADGLATTGGGTGGGGYLTMSADDFFPADRTKGTVSAWVQKRIPEAIPYQTPLVSVFGIQWFDNASYSAISAFWGDGVTYQPGINFYVATADVVVHNAVDSGWNALPTGEWIHMGFVWDLNGIDGSQDIVRIYRDDVLVAANDDVVGNFNIYPDTLPVKVLGHHAYSRLGEPMAYLDNLIVWDSAKTDFSGRFSASPVADTDGDGIPDDQDVCPLDFFNDSDGDGVCDSDDVCLGDDASGDGDADGLCDDSDPCFGASNSDMDGDAVCDEGDLCWGDDATGNSDGDGVCDDLDACEGDDAAGDTDADLFCDDIDACPFDLENDADGDGICEIDDNCDVVSNPNQNDNDSDGAGDVCDDDDDNDGVLDPDDNCQLDANADQADFDGDGAGDVCDTDDDNDGVLDADDACLTTPTGAIVNGDGCAIVDLCPCENNWKNHGAYVRCVSHTANDFIDLGLIGETEHGDIVSDAAQSDCGHRN